MDNKQTYYDGVDMSLYDLSLLSSVPVAWAKVVDKMFKRGLRTYLGISEHLLPGEIIQTGRLGIRYKIVNATKHPSKGKGFIYEIKRVDGQTITSVDILNSYEGGRVRITNRRNFKQKLGTE